MSVGVSTTWLAAANTSLNTTLISDTLGVGSAAVVNATLVVGNRTWVVPTNTTSSVTPDGGSMSMGDSMPTWSPPPLAGAAVALSFTVVPEHNTSGLGNADVVGQLLVGGSGWAGNVTITRAAGETSA